MFQMRATHRASVVVVLALAAGACTGAGAGASPSVVPTGTATSPAGTQSKASPTTPAPTTSPTTSPTSKPSVAITACPFKPVGYPGGSAAIKAPSDRLVDVVAKSGSARDTLTFVFDLKGPASPSGTSPTLRVRESKPPFSYGGSGKSFDVKGDRYIEVVFDGVTIADANGTEVFKGGAFELGKFTGLRDAVQYDDFEGVLGWIVGVSDPACITVGAGAANEVVLSITHN